MSCWRTNDSRRWPKRSRLCVQSSAERSASVAARPLSTRWTFGALTSRRASFGCQADRRRTRNRRSSAERLFSTVSRRIPRSFAAALMSSSPAFLVSEKPEEGRQVVQIPQARDVPGVPLDQGLEIGPVPPAETPRLAVPSLRVSPLNQTFERAPVAPAHRGAPAAGTSPQEDGRGSGPAACLSLPRSVDGGGPPPCGRRETR